MPEGSRGSIESLAWLRDQITDADRLEKVAALEPLARQMGASLAQFALAWCLQNPWVSTVITGASRVEQVHENMKAVSFVDGQRVDEDTVLKEGQVLHFVLHQGEMG